MTGTEKRGVATAAMPALKTLSLWHLRLPLTVPYRLSFGTQYSFETLLVGVTFADGRTGFGDGTILPGYTEEAIETAWPAACALVEKVAEGGDLSDLAATLLDEMPFTATAFLTAIDHATEHPMLARTGRVPMLGTVNAKVGDPGLDREVEDLLTAGHTVLKVKVGFGLEQDLEQVRAVRAALRGRALMRVDGNQGYDADTAIRFVERLDPEGIELLEQPCPAGDWDAAKAVKQAATVPMMLDESIYGLAEIDRAADDQLADFIKLKLMKMGSLDRLDAGLARIKDRGMEPILGNGVATDLGCWMECAAFLGRASRPGEMNGFLKTTHQLLTPALTVENGAVVMDGKPRTVDPGRLSPITVAHHQIGVG